ncbi:MAG: LacI family DNA-binding transcriptional regulator [Clostridiales Family XIII bacterium]|nr:LacI family DNA-binding transcriptional regulator [Clostridiales Family XIII bacterium]
MITIKEIAELAGTSRGTVDRVLNKRGKVKAEVEKRVIEIAERNNYRTNPFARALLRGGHGHLIGVIMNSKGNRFFDEVIRGIRETADKYSHYGLEVRITEIKGYNESEQLMALDEMLRLSPAALAITPIDTKPMRKRLSEIEDIPVVMINQDIKTDAKMAFIGCDYKNSGRVSGDIAILSLPEGGKVAIVTGSFKMRGHNQRIEGFKEVVAKGKGIEIAGIAENNDDNEISYDVTKKLIEDTLPDVIYFCAAGAEGGIKAVKESGRKIKIIVVDDYNPLKKYLGDGTIQAIVTQQPYRQGADMIELLYDFLLNGKRPAKVNNYTENTVKLPHSSM